VEVATAIIEAEGIGFLLISVTVPFTTIWENKKLAYNINISINIFLKGIIF
jgi:hypothetical protein